MASRVETSMTNRRAALDQLHRRTAALDLFEFWSEEEGYAHAAAEKLQWRIAAVPHLWRFRDVEPCLRTAGELIPLEISERRSLIMVNPEP